MTGFQAARRLGRERLLSYAYTSRTARGRAGRRPGEQLPTPSHRATAARGGGRGRGSEAGRRRERLRGPAGNAKQGTGRAKAACPLSKLTPWQASRVGGPAAPHISQRRAADRARDPGGSPGRGIPCSRSERPPVASASPGLVDQRGRCCPGGEAGSCQARQPGSEKREAEGPPGQVRHVAGVVWAVRAADEAAARAALWLSCISRAAGEAQSLGIAGPSVGWCRRCRRVLEQTLPSMEVAASRARGSISYSLCLGGPRR